MAPDSGHVPVLVDEVRKLAVGSTRAVDCTLGGGGHARMLLESGADLLGLDADPAAVAYCRSLFGREATILHSFFDSPSALQAIRDFGPDFVLLDLGLSSDQVDDDSRGFSFRRDVPLDMRMSPGSGTTAADVLNTYSEAELGRLFRDFADERRHRRLAAEVVKRRAKRRFETSDDLVNAVRAVLGSPAGPAEFARIFQALRIEVNRELDRLETVLPDLRDALISKGKLAVITYHSGEDRIVKRAFREWAQRCVCPPRQPICTCRGRPLGRLVWRRPQRPGPEEITANPRARSAKLRAFEKDGGS